MSKFFVNNNQINNDIIYIVGSDINHIKNVLRLDCKEKITLCNNDTSENYETEIINISKERIECKILSKLEKNTESNIHINIFQGLPKFEKMELIIEKCTEIGVNEITPIIMKRCVVKIDDTSKEKKKNRWQKISEVAAKQSNRSIIPKVGETIKIKDIEKYKNEYDLIMVAYENEKSNTLKKELIKLKDISSKNIRIGVIIGPEGGIDKQELHFLQEIGIKPITVGDRILRTETAPIVISSIIMYELGD